MRFLKKKITVKKNTDLVAHNQRGIGVKYYEKLATLKGFLLLHREIFEKKNHRKKHTDLIEELGSNIMRNSR